MGSRSRAKAATRVGEHAPGHPPKENAGEQGESRKQTGFRRWLPITLIVSFTAFLGGVQVWKDTVVDAVNIFTGQNPEAVEVDEAASPVNEGGWGPERTTFTTQVPAAIPVLNSITDNPAHGDERNFVQVRNTVAGGVWEEDIRVTPGDTVEVFVYVSNNAASNTADSIIRGLSVRFITGEGRSAAANVTVVLDAVNAEAVWDSASVHADSPVTLEYVNGSGRVHFPDAPDTGHPLEDTVFRSGGRVMLGNTALDGKLTSGPSSDGVMEAGSGYIKFSMLVVP